MKRLIIIVLILAVLAGVAFWRYYPTILAWTLGEKNQQVKLTYWGLWDEEAVMLPLITEYQLTHPNIQISYAKQSAANYRTRLQTQIRAEQGPDIFQIHNSWIPMFLQDITPIPENIFLQKEYSQTFYPVAVDNLTYKGQIYALPLEIDGLAMFYNPQILEGAGVAIPTKWEQFPQAAERLVVRDQLGQTKTAGAALGTTSNVEFWPEIIQLLFLQQPNSSLVSPATREGVEVLNFYTRFLVDPGHKVWDVTLPVSSQMFAEGRLAFYFATSRQIQTIKTANPNLNFQTAAVPQLSERPVGVATFWVESVSKNSKQQKEAWEFLKFLSTKESLVKLNANRVAIGQYPRVYPRMDMQSMQLSDPHLGIFVTQAPYYKSWFLSSTIADSGINQEVISAYKQAIDRILQGNDPLQSLQTTQAQLLEILPRYIKVN